MTTGELRLADSPAKRTESPLLSVIIPAYRRPRQLRAALESVLATGLDLEVAVIDDDPERSAKEVVAGLGDPRVAYHAMSPVSGGRPALVRNRGIELVRGRYLYFLDDDDCVNPAGLEQAVREMERRGAHVAFGRVRCVGPDAKTVREYNEWFTWAARTARRYRRSSWLTTGIIMFRGTVIINSACVISRAAALKLGGYDPALPVYEDVEFFARAMRRFGHAFVDTEILVYSTGQPSLIHDLQGDTRPIQDSYRLMHARYKERHGTLEYRLLQCVSKVLPLPRRGK